MGRGLMRYGALLCFLLLLMSIGGVFATWYYVDDNVLNVDEYLNVSLSEFVWKPEEILPTDSVIGENHLALIELILNENEKGYGLNYDKKNVLESYLNSEGIVLSNQKTSGGNIKFVSDETSQLYYIVEKISNTLYYAYTFSYVDLNSAVGTDKEIPVYRTILEKTDKWRAPRSFLGYAQTISLRDLGFSNLSGTLSYTIDPSTWSQR